MRRIGRLVIFLLYLQLMLGSAQEELVCADLSTERVALYPYEARFVMDATGDQVLDRCEGAYAGRRLSSLSVRTFTAQFEGYRFDREQPLTISWDAPDLDTSDRVRLHAQSVVRRVFYRMDSERAIQDASYHWPLSILEGLRIGPDHLGVLGFTHVPIEGAPLRVHLPLRITQLEGPSPPTRYRVGVWTESRLEAVWASVSPLEDDGSVGEFLPAWNRRERPQGNVPSEQLFTISIPVADLPAPGLYVLSIDAHVYGAGTSTTKFYFLHSTPGAN